MSYDPPIRKRWGTFSVIDHLDRGALVPEVLLYDTLVFPKPSDDRDRDRWEEKNWKPDQLDKLLADLDLKKKGLTYTVPWSQALRQEWSNRMKLLTDVGLDACYGMTQRVVARAVGVPENPPPIVLAAYQSEKRCVAEYELGDFRAAEPNRREQVHREIGALFQRRLSMPRVDESPERTFDQAVDLALTEEFQKARRALYDWEDSIVLSLDWPVQTAIKELESRVANHNDLIQRHFQQTWTRRIYRVVKWAGAGGLAIANPYLGLGVAGALELIECKFPSLNAEPPDPDKDPGAALYKAMGALYHD